MSSAAAIAALALVVASALGGCAGHIGLAPTTPTATTPLPATATSIPSTTPVDAAATLLRTAILPPGVTLTSAIVAEPAESPACDPLTTATENVLVPHASLSSVSEFLKSHPVPSLGDVSTGRMTTTSGVVLGEDVVEEEDAASTMLVFTFQPGDGGVDLRVDAEVVPAGSSCTSSGGGTIATPDATR